MGRRFVYLVPILMTFIFIASLTAIITNSLTLVDNVNRTYYFSNIEPDNYKDTFVIIPSSISHAELFIQLNMNLENSNLDPLVDIYLFEDEPDRSLKTTQDLLSSDYYDSDYIIGDKDVKNNVTFTLAEDFDQLYLVVANTNNAPLDVSLSINISDANSFSGESVFSIIAIFFSSLITLVSLLFGAFTWIEAIEPYNYEAMLLTNDLELKLEQFYNDSDTWHLLFVLSGLILTPYAIFAILNSSTDNFVIVITIALLGIALLSFNNKRKDIRQMKALISQKGEMSLAEISQQLGKEQKDTRKLIVDLMADESYDIHYDFESKTIYKFTPAQDQSTKTQRSTQTAPSEIVSNQSQANSAENPSNAAPEMESGQLPECPYCGEEAITIRAEFCHSCGASISPAK